MRGYVAVGDRQIHYRAAGDRGPALVLFHESPLSSRIFERALPLLGRWLRVWAFDTPGYGMSDPPDRNAEIPEYATLLLSAIDRLGIGSFAAFGCHTGAELAIELASRLPQRVTHAILSGVPLLTDAERAAFLSTWAPDLELDQDGRYLAWAWQRYIRLWGPDTPPELLNEGVVATVGNYRHYNSAYNAAFRYDPAPQLEALRCPILLLNPVGDRFAFADSRVLLIQPMATIIRIAGMSGQLPWREPATFASNITEFVLRTAAA